MTAHNEHRFAPLQWLGLRSDLPDALHIYFLKRLVGYLSSAGRSQRTMFSNPWTVRSFHLNTPKDTMIGGVSSDRSYSIPQMMHLERTKSGGNQVHG